MECQEAERLVMPYIQDELPTPVLEEFLEQQEMKAQQRRALAQRRNQQAQLMQIQMQMMGSTNFGQAFPGYMTGSYPASLVGAILSGGGKWKA